MFNLCLTSGRRETLETDRRKHFRFLAQENAFVVLRHEPTRIGKIKDISSGGLSFEHIYEGKFNGGNSKNNLTLWTNGFRMTEISCRIVYDLQLPIPPEYDSLTIQLVPKRCGIEFESLTDHQIAQLDFFLKNYTRSEND